MKHRTLISTALISTFAMQASAEDMLVERVRYCTSAAAQNICADSALNPKFSDWEKYGVERQEQKETYISIINQPDREKVKRVVFISAGQQINKGFPNALTGQTKAYKKDCTDRTPSCSRSIHPKSLVARLRASGEFDDNETLYISVLDAKFGYFRTPEQSQAREDAYWDFLTSKFDAKNIELMVLAGQSRAGCLAFRLGRRMRHTSRYADIPLIVQGYDAVCKTDAVTDRYFELPHGGNGTVNNPYDSSKKSFLVDMGKAFPPEMRENLKLLNIHAGGKVAHLDTIRAFTWKARDVDLGWWKQKWVNYEHNYMGGYLYENDGNTAKAIQDIGDVGYGHIYNFSKYELGRPQPTNFRATPRHPVDINGDKKSDIVLAYRHPQQGLKIRSKLSNGDGTYTAKEYVAGDGMGIRDWGLHSGYFNRDNNTDILVPYQHPTQGLKLRLKLSNGDGTFAAKSFTSGDGASVNEFPLFVGDVDGDGLSDVILRNQHPSQGLQIRTKFSKGDGTFRSTSFIAGDGNLGKTQRSHVGDVNGDKKTDLIYLYQRSSDKKLEIRTRPSNGDGTYGFHKTQPLQFTKMTNIQSFVADVNRDRKSDIIVLERGRNGLEAHTFFFKANGQYDRVIEKFPDGPDVDVMETIIADVNGDRRSDIVMRVRDKDKGLILKIKQSNGDGRYTPKEVTLGDGAMVDDLQVLSGHYDTGRSADLALRYRHPQNGLIIRTKNSRSDGSFVGSEFKSGDGDAVDAIDALSGPIHWDGGATFFNRTLNDTTADVAKPRKMSVGKTMKQIGAFPKPEKN